MCCFIRIHKLSRTSSLTLPGSAVLSLTRLLISTYCKASSTPWKSVLNCWTKRYKFLTTTMTRSWACMRRESAFNLPIRYYPQIFYLFRASLHLHHCRALQFFFGLCSLSYLRDLSILLSLGPIRSSIIDPRFTSKSHIQVFM